VAAAFANQAAYCKANGAPITARIVQALAALLDDPGAGTFISRIRDWPGAASALADAVPLRAAGAIHALHISGREPMLNAIYDGSRADDAAIIREVLARGSDDLLPWLDGPPQTNEAGRSSSFIAALHWLAAQGLTARFECLEIGSSAGINLMIDRYRYDLGGVVSGPQAPVMAFAPEWRGSPPPNVPFGFAGIKGCDVAPVDLADPVQAERLRAYIWPEHTVRFARMDAAIAAATDRRPDLVRMGAADFLERELARPQAPGTTRVLMHSIVWQYIPAQEQDRIRGLMDAAGARADADRALAWVALEADRTKLGHTLRVMHWPGEGEEWLLARAHAHGAWIEWLA